MQTATAICDKSLRDIWAATDKSTIDILQDRGERPNKAPLHVKQNTLSHDEKTSSHFNSMEKNNLKDVEGLFQPKIRTIEDDNVSLYSIWTPTNNDNLKNQPRSFYESPLIDLDTPETQQTNARVLPTNSLYGTHGSPLIDLPLPKNSNIYTSFKDYNYESPLIDLKMPEDSCPKYRNECTLPKDYTYTNISSHNKGNNLINDHDSEKSLDELNEETFGKFSYNPNESKWTLSDISEATAACQLNENQFTQISKTPRGFEYSDTTKDVQEVKEMTTGAKPKTYKTKVYKQNNVQQCYQHRDENRNGKNGRKLKGQTASNLIKTKSNEILSLSRENLTICKARPLQGTFRRNATNNERRRLAPRARETFHSKGYPNEQTEVATHTLETFHKKGNNHYYTSEKIIYVRGEKLENTYKKAHKDQENNIVWRNVSDFNRINGKEVIRNNNTKIKKYFQDDAVPYHCDKNKMLSNFDMNTSYEGCKFEEDNGYRFKNQSNVKRDTFKQPNCLDQKKPSKKEITQGGKISFRDEPTGQCIWQFATDKSDSDEPDDTPQDKASGFKNKTIVMEHNDKKNNVIHFKVFDPKQHRPTKKIITINQNNESMKLKSNLFRSAQTEQNEVPYTASGSSLNEDSKEKFDSKTITEEYPKRTELKSSPFGYSKNEKSKIPCTQSEESNKNLRDHFLFLENVNLNKTDTEHKTFVKDVLSDLKNNGTPQTPRMQQNSTTLNSTKNDLKSSIICEGKEIADLIVGSQRGLEMFKSFYDEWIELRKQSISLLEQIVMIINKSSRKNDTMKHVVAAINIAAAGVANLVPHPGVALGARVAGAVGGFFATFFNRPNGKEDVNTKKFEIKEIFQKDIDSSSYVYIYGVQCSSQFQETCHAISKLYKQLHERNYQSVIDNEELLEFMGEITEYNSINIVFYKRLRMCYERLIKTSNSVDSRAFVRIFEDVPDAVDVIDLLPWKFDSDGFDNSIVQNAWDELFLLFQDDNPATVDIIKKRIEDCLFFLKKEERILSRNVMGLFRKMPKQLSNNKFGNLNI